MNASALLFDRTGLDANRTARALIGQARDVVIAIRETERGTANRLALDSCVACLRDAEQELATVAGEDPPRWGKP